MKRLLSIFLAAVMLMGVMPWQIFAEEEPVQGNEIILNRKGQWIGESSQKVDKEESYSSSADPIGEPLYNSGLLRSFAKVFLGWSDYEPVENGKVAPGAKLFSSQDSVKTYQEYVDKMKKEKGAEYKGDKNVIYAIYYEINGFNIPLAGDKFGAVGQVLGNVGNLKSLVNKNEIFIDKSIKVEEILKNTEIAEDNREKGNGNANIIGRYDGKDIELGLESEFSMDDSMAMLAYKNKVGTNQLRPILSSDDNTRYKKGDFPTEDEKYTYVDINMDFGTDEGLIIPDNLFLELRSYSWRPLYAFGINDDGSKTVLQMLDKDGNKLSENPGIVTQDAFKSIGSGKKPESRFGVVTKVKDADGKKKQYRKITVRVVLREWDNSVEKPHQNPFSGERIPENSISAGLDGTKVSELLSNMTLRVLGSKEKKDFVKLTKEKAKELADSNASKKIEVKGSIKGQVYLNAAGFEIPIPINNLDSKPFSISLINKREPKPNPTPDSNTAPKISFFVLPEEEEKDTRPREDHLAYIFGYVDKTVRPEGTLTRAEAAAMVTRLGKLDLSDTSKADYPDLRDKAWYLGNINAALRAGMLDTDEKGNLRPDQPVTRAEFIKMVAAIDKAGEGKAPFTDIAGHKYEKEINQVYSNKRIAGYKDGTFKPDAFLSRAEAAAFLNRVFNRVADDVAIQGFEGSIKKFTDLDIKSWCYYELVEATNSHELVRRNGKDAMDRTFEDWTRLLNQ